jgi:UDP-N-acetylglucosamine 2-epimerase (non-hydrolysing)
MQEETAVLGVPCITLRASTERPITTEQGTSRLVGNDAAAIRGAVADALQGRWAAPTPIAGWDGHAAARIATILANCYA